MKMIEGITAATAALLLTFTWGCAQRASSPMTVGYGPDSETTVRVENVGLSAVAVYSTSGGSARIATVMPGQTECVELRRTDERQRLIARPVGGGPRTVSPVFEARPGDGWEWNLANTPELDRISLKPASRCET